MDHKAFFRPVAGADTAVLLVHGIVGTPRQFDFLLDMIPQNWSIYNLLLDGHGRSVGDFSRTSMKKWKQQVADALSELCRTHERVYLIGHSMGTMLEMEAVRDHPQVAGLLLLGVPLRPWLKISMCLRSVGYALGILPKSDPLWKACSVKPDWRLWRYIGWIPRFWELLRLCSRWRREIAHVQLPVWAVQSQKDEMVSMRSSRYLRNHPSIRYVQLPQSMHFSYSPEDVATIRGCFDDMIHRQM